MWTRSRYNPSSGPWGILPEALQAVASTYRSYIEDPHATGFDAAQQPGGETKSGAPYENAEGVAILTLGGILAPHPDLITFLFDGTSLDSVTQGFRRAQADPKVTAILLYIDSPGGLVQGVQELAKEIMASRGKKPIIAFTDGLMASAAYWIAAAADRVFISGNTTLVGSIGIVASHVDFSGAERLAGRKVTPIVAGRYKGIAHEHAPLTDQGARYMQDQVNYLYKVFIRDLTAFRSALEPWAADESETNRAPWADGKLFVGSQAIDARLVDGVRNISELIGIYGSGRTSPTARATGEAAPRRALTEMEKQTRPISAIKAEVEAQIRKRRAEVEKQTRPISAIKAEAEAQIRKRRAEIEAEARRGRG
jgi:signal peptide peptidase SppA